MEFSSFEYFDIETVLVGDRDDFLNEDRIEIDENRLQTDLISFTNVNRPPAAPKIDITETYESQSVSGNQLFGDGLREGRLIPDSEQASSVEVKVGDYLRRIPVTTGGKYYPELIAEVIREGAFGWVLTCAEGKSWRCPFNMLGQTWEMCSM